MLTWQDSNEKFFLEEIRVHEKKMKINNVPPRHYTNTNHETS